MTERKRLERLRAGDSEVLRQIIQDYGPYVQAIAANITIPPLQPEDVEEVASDVFLALWKNAGSIEEGKLKYWLAAVTRNTAKNKLRHLHLTTPFEEEYMVLTVPDTEENILSLELKELTRQAVDALGSPEREIFIRHYFLYQKVAEIASALELNPATVRTKLARGREKLKAYLEERGYGCENAADGLGQ